VHDIKTASDVCICGIYISVSPVVVINILLSVTSLMVEGNTNIVCRSVHAGATRKLVHRRRRALSTGEISIAANGCKGCSGSEIVIRERS